MVYKRTVKKVALIVNGDPNFPGPSLAQSLEKQGFEVDTILIGNIIPDKGKFFLQKGDSDEEIDPKKYTLVMRSIMGGTPGDTDKSLQLQEYLEKNGVKAHMPSKTVRLITDKINCTKILQAAQIPVVPSIFVKRGESVPVEEIMAMGLPCIVKKSIGSGKNALTIAHTIEDVDAAVKAYASGSFPRDAIIQKYKPNMTPEIADFLEVDPKDRSYHYRVVLVNGRLFGSYIFYSNAGEYSLNSEQGALCKTLPRSKLPEEILDVAQRALVSFPSGAIPRVAAIDVTLNKFQQPCVLDMNVSPNMSVFNDLSQSLMDFIANDARKAARGFSKSAES